ncbi:hypothetical protein HaLaN_16657 [Haematococcus lacustris]|uniref:Secreted protein n=1 Tax=Haematococcus lacustris TaxID=44745 RepID=A0A699ZD22_HAELA|nr:hypothetical protein HaLaN_16657 [Haematococcus lacustris]
MHEAVTRQFVLLAFYLSWLPLDVAEILLGEMVAAGMAEKAGVRIVGQLGLGPGWETWGPYCGLHRDRGNVNVGRVVFNLGGGGVVNLHCGDEELSYWLEHGWGYFMGPIASGKAHVSDDLFCQHSVLSAFCWRGLSCWWFLPCCRCNVDRCYMQNWGSPTRTPLVV